MFADCPETLHGYFSALQIEANGLRPDIHGGGQAETRSAKLIHRDSSNFPGVNQLLGQSRRAPIPSPVHPFPCRGRECIHRDRRWLSRKHELSAPYFGGSETIRKSK